MTSSQKIIDKSDADSGAYRCEPGSDADPGAYRCELGVARVRDAVFDAVYELWLRRESEGLKKKDIANLLGKHPSWVSRSLAGPGNWTLETFGALVEALDSQAEIILTPREDLIPDNYSIYADLIDGVAHTYCPITDFKVNSNGSGGNFTVTIGKNASPTGMSTIRTTRIMTDA